MKEIEDLVKGIPQTYWYDKKAREVFIEKAVFLKEKGLEIEEIKDLLKSLYFATSNNNGSYGKRVA